MDLHTTCKDYDFCTPETREELEKNGFDFSVCKFGITEFIAGRMKMGFIVETNGAIPYPTFNEVWRLLPRVVKFKGNEYYLEMSKFSILYSDTDNIILQLDNKGEDLMRFKNEKSTTEAACLLWLKLKKGGFLNG